MLAVVVAVLVALAFLLLAGLTQRGAMTRTWARTSRVARGRRYGGD